MVRSELLQDMIGYIKKLLIINELMGYDEGKATPGEQEGITIDRALKLQRSSLLVTLSREALRSYHGIL